MIIVHKEMPIEKFEYSEIKSIFTRKIKFAPNRYNSKVEYIVYIYHLDSIETKDFLNFLNLTKDKYLKELQDQTNGSKKYRVIFVKDKDTMLKNVSRSKYSIGFVYSLYSFFPQTLDKNIKVIEINRRVYK
jgi:ABC-type phosphate transport system substrate-binding protein